MASLSKVMRLCVVSHTRDLIEEHTKVEGRPPTGGWLSRHIALFVEGVCYRLGEIEDYQNGHGDRVRYEAEKVLTAGKRAARRAETYDADARTLVMAGQKATTYRFCGDGAATFYFVDGSRLIRGFPGGIGSPAVWEVAHG